MPAAPCACAEESGCSDDVGGCCYCCQQAAAAGCRPCELPARRCPTKERAPTLPRLPCISDPLPQELGAAKAAAKTAEAAAEKLAGEKKALLQELAFGRGGTLLLQ